MGWLLLAAAVVVAALGVVSRLVVGRNADRPWIDRPIRAFRRTRVAGILFGPVTGDALDGDELDQLIVLPTIVVSSGLCLTAVFLLGYEALT